MISFQFEKENPASGLHKVRADIFDRFFGSLPFRSGFKARRAEGRCGGIPPRRAQRVPFGYFQTDTAS